MGWPNLPRNREWLHMSTLSEIPDHKGLSLFNPKRVQLPLDMTGFSQPNYQSSDLRVNPAWELPGFIVFDLNLLIMQVPIPGLGLPLIFLKILDLL
jgi:hypothetical protein